IKKNVIANCECSEAGSNPNHQIIQMKKMTVIIIVIITVLCVAALGLIEMAFAAGEPQQTAVQAQKQYAANELLPYIIDPDTAKGKLLAVEQYRNCPPLRPERFRRKVKMLWGIDINDYPADAIFPIGQTGYDIITLSKRYQLLSGHHYPLPPVDMDDGPAFIEHHDFIYEHVRKFVFFGDDDARRTLLDYNEQWYGREYEVVISADFLIMMYHSMPFSQDVGLIEYNDKNPSYMGLLMEDGPLFSEINLISAKYSDSGLLEINLGFDGELRMIQRISDMRCDLLSLYIRQELSKGRILIDNPSYSENTIFLGQNLFQDNGMGFLPSLYYNSDPRYHFCNPWHNYSLGKGVSSYLAFLLQLQNKFTDKQVIKYMSGQFDKYHLLSDYGDGNAIRKDIKENNYYGYSVLREFFENPMREMPTLEKIGSSFRACVKGNNTLLLLEPFVDSYDIDTVQPTEFLKAYEMGHDDYWFVEVEKPVESPVADMYGYATILDRTETVYGYIPKQQVKALTDADILQWETMHDTTKSKLGIIDDPDGYVNIRKGQNAQSEIAGQIKKDEVFRYWELPTNWCVVETEAGLRGFVYKIRIKEYRDKGKWTLCD
ncbi:MAG: SH3 domain-containing protein, partial [Prevotellaceae bacterium]|nr:SH3 domain-containing protein [Prevotellaceae bacterium]